MNTSMLQDLSILYELSLNIGQSLELEENCRQFLRTLMARKSLIYGAVWIRNQEVRALSLTCSIPHIHERQRNLSQACDIENKYLAGKEASKLQLSPYADKKGKYLIIKLGEIGFLELYHEQKEDVLSSTELNKLGHILDKFTNSIQACLNHQQLAIAREKAESSSKAKELFLANMSHEIRTPMNAILGMTQLLKDTPLNQQQAKYLDVLLESGKGLLTIVNDILDISKINAGEITFEERPLNIHELTESIDKAQRHKAEKKGIKFNVANHLPNDLEILGDEVRIKQVLNNLVNNAIKFTEKGEVKFSVLQEEAEFVFIIEDTGKGIAPENLDKIFEAFKQEDNTVTRAHGGTGLGLAICKKILEIQKANISVESTLHQGSKFTVRWPLTTIDQPAQSEENSDRHMELPVDIKILLAEDNRFNQMFAASLFGMQGIKIDMVENGEQAIEKAQSKAYDVILMDIQMPVLDGVEACYVLKAKMAENCPPIIALTANAIKGDKEKFLSQGFDGYVSKPFEADELFGKIAELMK